MLELIAAIEAAGTDDRVRVIVLEGAGEHFCGGADIVARNAPAETKPRAGSIQRRLPTQAHRLIPLLCSVQVPVVCKVRGWAAGIGFQIALAADITIAADDARSGSRSASAASPPTAARPGCCRAGSVRCARASCSSSGARSAARKRPTGARSTGRSPARSSTPRSTTSSGSLANGPTVALGLTKWLLHAGATAELPAQLANEAFALELSSRTEDFREGMAAFREKRPPRFEGR